MDVECGLAEEGGAALAVELQQLPLDRPDAGLGDVAVFGAQHVGIFGAIGEHRLEVGKIEQQQLLFIGVAEGDVEDAFLRLVEVHQAREEQRPHLADRGANRVTLFAVQVPEDRRIIRIDIGIEADFGGARDEFVRILEGR